MYCMVPYALRRSWFVFVGGGGALGLAACCGTGDGVSHSVVFAKTRGLNSRTTIHRAQQTVASLPLSWPHSSSCCAGLTLVFIGPQALKI